MGGRAPGMGPNSSKAVLSLKGLVVGLQAPFALGEAGGGNPLFRLGVILAEPLYWSLGPRRERRCRASDSVRLKPMAFSSTDGGRVAQCRSGGNSRLNSISLRSTRWPHIAGTLGRARGTSVLGGRLEISPYRDGNRRKPRLQQAGPRGSPVIRGLPPCRTLNGPRERKSGDDQEAAEGQKAEVPAERGARSSRTWWMPSSW